MRYKYLVGAITIIGKAQLDNIQLTRTCHDAILTCTNLGNRSCMMCTKQVMVHAKVLQGNQLSKLRQILPASHPNYLDVYLNMTQEYT